jgi:hypothetical protein
MARSVATVTVVSPIAVTNPVANAYSPDCGNVALPESFPTVSNTLCGLQEHAFCSQTKVLLVGSKSDDVEQHLNRDINPLCAALHYPSFSIIT